MKFAQKTSKRIIKKAAKVKAKKSILKIAKYGQFLSSRPEGREAALAAWAYHENLKKSSTVKFDFTGIIVMTPSWLSEFVNTLRDCGIKKIEYLTEQNLSVRRSIQAVLADDQNHKVHPWRLCPTGQHWVRKHPLRVAPSKKHPDGEVTIRNGHCASNPSGKDQLYPDEIKQISSSFFSNLSNVPCPSKLGFEDGAKFDSLIAGWVQYWNEVLIPKEFLDPNLVKALIASESSFNAIKLASKKDSNSARGLMQILNKTRKIIADESGELKNHYVTANKKDLDDPNVNICAGVRWLFRKKDLASLKLKRPATWVEAAEEYKGDLKGIIKKDKKSVKDVEPFLKLLKELQECAKK